VAAAIVVAIVALLVLRPFDGASDRQATAPAGAGGNEEAQPSEQAASDGGQEVRESRPAEPKTPVHEIEVEGGQPAGGAERIEVEKGEPVKLEVSSDSPEQVHVHGYDEYADVAPGEPAKLSFPADIEGIYEIELEGAHTQIAELEVRP